MVLTFVFCRSRGIYECQKTLASIGFQCGSRFDIRYEDSPQDGSECQIYRTSVSLLLYNACEGTVIMPTTREEKPAKPRQRSRKTDQQRAKGEKKVEVRSESDAVSAVMAPIEAAAVRGRANRGG